MNGEDFPLEIPVNNLLINSSSCKSNFHFHPLCTGSLEYLLITAKKRTVNLDCHSRSLEAF